MRPIIGITPDEGTTAGRTGRPSLPRYELKRAYVDAVTAAGGLPIILPYLADEADIDTSLHMVRGIVVTGGAFDIDPSEYGAPPHPKLGPVNLERTRFERRLMTRALERGLPVFGICGGMQLLNVVRGGSLIQDLASERPDASNHEQPHDPREPGHGVEVMPGTLLSRIAGVRLEANTTHHQAVDEVGDGLSVSASAPDGVIEAIEDPKARFVVGVQWHPELLKDSANASLFQAFVAAARG